MNMASMIPRQAHTSNLGKDEDHGIFRLADQCRGAFEDIYKAQSEESLDRARIELLFSHPKGRQSILTLQDLEDDHEQFRVWAKNLGVFATDHNSLDFRLQEAKDVKEGILSLLSSLRLHLVTILSNLKEDCECHELDSDSSGDEELDRDDAKLLEPDTFDPLRATSIEIQTRLEHVAEIVNKLIKLATIVRASGALSRNVKAAKYVHYEDGVNVTKEFEETYLPAILKFRYKLESPLLERFSKAISLRRRRFLFQAKNQRKLAFGVDPASQRLKKLIPVKGLTTLLIEPANLRREEADPVAILVEDNHSASPSSTQPSTKATTFQGLHPKLRAPSTIVPASTKSVTATVSIPPPPRISGNAAYFQCPYCCLLVPREKQVNREWRKHFIADLQPFVCIEPECHSANPIFETHRDWIEHQKCEHAAEWWCEGDDSTHAPSRFLSAQEYISHLQQTHHSRMSSSELSRQADLVANASLAPFSCCPFCDISQEDLLPGTTQCCDDFIFQTTKSQQDLQNHIADEMLAMFLIALPSRTDDHDSDIESDLDESERVRSTLRNRSHGTLTFMSKDDFGRDLEVTSSSEFDYNTTVSETSRIPGPLPEEVWDAVWSSSRMRESVRKSYEGFAKDKLLQDFASKALKSLPHSDAELEVDGIPIIMAASELGYEEVTKRLFAAGVVIDVPSEEGVITALLEASKVGEEQIVKKLLTAGVGVDSRIEDNTSSTALMIASAYGHEKIVQTLISAEAEINSKGGLYDTTALIEASECGHERIVDMLLVAGADVNLRSGHNDTTPLIAASRGGHKQLVDTFLAAGADVNDQGENEGTTALILASDRGHSTIVQILLEAGADVNAQGGYFNTTALMAASRQGHEMIVKRLIVEGANVNAVGGIYGNTTALTAAYESPNEEIFRQLIKAGAKRIFMSSR